MPYNNKFKQQKYNKTYKPNRQKAFTITKMAVLTYYGNGKCACVQCGYSDIRALTIDHINSDGAIHRKELNIQSGMKFYYWLKRLCHERL